MKKGRFTEVEIVKILSKHNQGKTINDICRDYGISQPTFYKRKSKYGEMEIHQLEKQLSQYKKRMNSEDDLIREELKSLAKQEQTWGF